MKSQINRIKGVLITGLLMLVFITSYAGEDKTKKIAGKKIVILVEQLNQLVKVVDEIELQIEKWMIIENFLPVRIVSENDLQIEDWMLDNSCLKINECDEELSIEPWMTKTNDISDYENIEEELMIENWMIE